jgi:hypothetical protein
MAFSKNYKTNFRFVEQSNQTYYHDVRVFIMGTDVSPWLMSDVSITYSKNGGINSASFSLSNQYNAFVLTTENLTGNNGKGTWRLHNPYSPSGQYSEQAKHSIWTLKNSDNHNIAHEVNSFGPLRGGDHNKASILKASKNASEAQSTVTYKYPFSPGSLVIHKFDHVRIFAKNPLTLADEWMCVFSGFLDLKPFNEDLVYGMSSIKVSCQDIRYAMQRMRTQANPAATIGNENAVQFAKGGSVPNKPDAGYFNDLVGPNSMTSHILGGVTFFGSISFLLLGKTPARGSSATAGAIEDVTDGSNVNTALNQVGKLSLGEQITFNPKDDVNKRTQILEEWNDLVLFREFGMMTEAAMIQVGQETHEWGKHSIWETKVHILRPAEGLPVSNMVEASVTQGRIGDKIQWASRLELLLDICENIDYVFYVSPWGDVIFEFPMWDFSPDDYGKKYEEVYKFQNHIISRDINDEGGEAVSAVTVESSQLQVETRVPTETPNAVNNYASNDERTRTIFSNALASRIGVQVKTLVKPGVSQEMLTQLGMIEFAKATADYNKFSFRAQYRPFMMLNRPIYDVDAYKIGTLNNLTTTWRLRESVDVDLDLNYVRRGEIDRKSGKVDFRFITGGDSSTISYNRIYDDRTLFGTGVSDTGNKAKEGDE